MKLRARVEPALIFTAKLALLCLTSTTVSARVDEVDGYVKTQMQKQRIPGLTLAVVRNGEVTKVKGYGLANVEHDVPAQPETVYQSGSVGKQFTATLVMILVEEGRLALDDGISKYLNNTPEGWKDITIRHLLTHTSGIGNFAPTDLNHRLDYTDEELLKKAAALPLAFAPGEHWSYSNTGYILLGMIINRVSGKFYGDLLRERVFAPLGMNTARVVAEADIIPNRAAGYRIIKGELKNQQYISPTLNRTADGTLYLTAVDMAKWDAALYTERLLKRASLEQMWTPVKLNNGKAYGHGFGWFMNEVRGHRLVEHGGGWQGFTAYIARYLDDKLTIIVLTNAFPADPGAIAHGVAELYNPGLRRIAIKLDERHLSTYAGQYELAPGFAFTVSGEGGKLMIQMGNRMGELFAESETRFFLKTVDAQITFVKNAGGRVTHLILHQGGVDMEARKVK